MTKQITSQGTVYEFESSPRRRLPKAVGGVMSVMQHAAHRIGMEDGPPYIATNAMKDWWGDGDEDVWAIVGVGGNLPDDTIAVYRVKDGTWWQLDGDWYDYETRPTGEPLGVAFVKDYARLSVEG